MVSVMAPCWRVAYDAFISYSHSADGRLAPAVQRGLQRLARPWYRARALRVFRDETGLSVNPHLWTSIEQALDESEWFVLLCSPEAAGSPWVEREVEHWLATKPVERILPVLTEGEIAWDGPTRRYAQSSNAIPPCLHDRFPEEPRHLDLRWAREEEQLDLGHARFRASIAELAAPIHGMPKDELESEDVRIARRARRLARGAAATLVLLTVVALVSGGFALANERRANREADRAREAAEAALGRQLAATARNVVDQVPDRALLLALEGHRINPELGTADALARVIEAQPEGLVRYLPAADPLGKDGVASTLASPDGSRLATTSTEGNIRIWDVASGTQLTTVDAATPVLVAWSPDGTALAWNDEANLEATALHVTDVETKDDREFSFGTRTAAFAPDGDRLAVVDTDGGRLVAVDGDATESFALGLTMPTAVAFSADGSRVVFAEQSLANGEARVQAFDTETLNAIGPAEPFPSTAIVPTPYGVVHLAIEDDRVTTVLRISPQGTVVEFDATTGAVVNATPAAPEVADQREFVVAVSPDLNAIATASVEDGQVRVRDTESGQELREPLEGGLRYSPSISGDPIETRTTAFAGDDGELVITGAADGTARIFAVDSATALVTETAIDEEPAGAALVTAASPDGRHIALAIGDGLALVDTEDGTVREETLPQVDGARAVAISDDGDVALAGVDEVVLWNPDANPQDAHTIDLAPLDADFGGAPKMIFGDARLAVIQYDSSDLGQPRSHLYFVDVATGNALEPRPDVVDGMLGAVQFDGSTLTAAVASGLSLEFSGRTWDATTGESQPVELPWQDTIDAVATTDGHVAVGLTDRGLIAWRDGEEVGLFEQRDLNVRWPFGLAHNGRLAASVLSGELRVWDTETGLPLGSPRRIATPEELVPGPVVFNDDDTAVAVVVEGTEGARLMRLELDSARWREIACTMANRDLTPAEWDREVGDLVTYRKSCSG